MKPKSLWALPVLMVAVSLPAFAQWGTSVWDSARQNAYSVDGQIKAILVNEDQQQILIKIKRLNSSDTETVKICATDQGSDVRNWQVSEKMSLLRQAFARGDSVRLAYSGSFDRCVSRIEYNAPQETARKTSSSQGI